MWILSARKEKPSYFFFGHWQYSFLFSLFSFNVYLPITHIHNKNRIWIFFLFWLFFHLSIANRFLNALFCLLLFLVVGTNKIYKFKMADVKFEFCWFCEMFLSFFSYNFYYYWVLTWTLDSGKLIFSATSSRMKISGYLVLPNSDSSTSSWARVNVVRSLRCFRGFTPEKKK